MTIVDRTITRHDHVIYVQWKTTNEQGIAGFQLRRQAAEDAALLLTPTPIEAHFTGQSEREEYLYEDYSAPQGAKIHYLLEIIALDGGVTTVELGTIDRQMTTYLPFAMR